MKSIHIPPEKMSAQEPKSCAGASHQLTLTGLFLDLRRVLDRYASFQRLYNRTSPLENREGPLGFGALAVRDFEMIPNSDVRDLHDAFGSRDRSLRISPELVRVTGDPARFQRAH